MSYNGSGTFNINSTGQPVVAGTVITASAFNALTADLATGLTTAITKDGQTTTTARITFAQGITSSLVTDSSSVSTGSIITAGGAGIAKNLYVGGIASFSAQPIFTSLTASSAVATDASKGLVSVTNTGTGNNVLATSPTLVTPALGTPASGILTSCTGVNYDGYKNRIINGAMVIDQRNAGASITPIDGQYSVDRWKFNVSQSSKFTAQQSSTAPAGFTNSLLVTSSSAYAVASGDYFLAEQDIEGLNCYDLAWGTASAKSVTLSFWVYSSLTGTFGGALVNSGLNRSYPFSYTINSASTWEQKTITIAGDTSGTWLTTNGVGIRVRFGIGVGTTYSGTAGSWAATNYVSATGAVSVVGTNGATFYITGVQLEKGSTATSFDYRPYGTELALCQRYYYKVFPTVANKFLGSGFVVQSTTANIHTQFAVPMRVIPSALEQNGSANNYMIVHAALSTVLSSVTSFSSADVISALTSATVASGLTSGQGCQLRTDSTNGANAYLAWSAEL